MDDNKRSSSLVRRVAVVGTILAVTAGGVASPALAAKVSPMRARGHVTTFKGGKKFDHVRISGSVNIQQKRAR